MIKTHTEQVIDVGNWDELVSETYGRPYSFQQQDGCKERQRVYLKVPAPDAYNFENDTVPETVNHDEMGVSFTAWLARDPAQPLANDDDKQYSWVLPMWWNRNFYPSVEVVANDLHARGLLPAGEYTIDIDW